MFQIINFFERLTTELWQNFQLVESRNETKTRRGGYNDINRSLRIITDATNIDATVLFEFHSSTSTRAYPNFFNVHERTKSQAEACTVGVIGYYNMNKKKKEKRKVSSLIPVPFELFHFLRERERENEREKKRKRE